MPYRKTRRSAETQARMRAGKADARMARPAPDYPPALPDLRRRIVIIDYDFGERVHTLDLYKTSRVDCYRVHVDGSPWKDRIGWSRILAGLRKSLPRLGSS
jgi:hypothetical protein